MVAIANQVIPNQTMISPTYDNRQRKALVDYVVDNNKSLTKAIPFAIQNIPDSAKAVAVLGCGIGWSSAELSRHHPNLKIVGIDPSPKMIDIANSIFGGPQVTFRVEDLLHAEMPTRMKFGTIVMLDFYQYIPREKRFHLHVLLKQSLEEEGVLLLTFPTLSMQEPMGEEDADKVQPVHEDVSREDMLLLAEELDAELAQYQEISVWQPNDYVHVIIRRKSLWNSIPRVTTPVTLESVESRKARVINALNVRVTPSGTLLARKGNTELCVVTAQNGAYSETFIHAHLERLPARIHHIYGKSGQKCDEEGNTLVARNKSGKVTRLLTMAVAGQSSEEYSTNAIARYLKQCAAQAVLAEYGTQAVEVLDACRKSGVPLIAHFHGNDAYNYEIMQKQGRRYPELFDYAAAIVVVSREMEQQILRLGAPREKVFYNPYGVDMGLFGEGDPANAPPHFVGVGRFVEKKAPYLTLLAFRKTLDRCPEASLTLIGDGPLLGTCQHLANALSIADRVNFAGVASPAEVAATLRGARAFVQHSLRAMDGDSEGMPLAILEAGATGIPVVSTRHAGIKDVIIEKDTGLLVDEGDADGMAQQMIRLAEEPALAATLGRAARARVAAQYSIERSIAGLWSIIDGVVSGRNGALKRGTQERVLQATM